MNLQVLVSIRKKANDRLVVTNEASPESREKIPTKACSDEGHFEVARRKSVALAWKMPSPVQAVALFLALSNFLGGGQAIDTPSTDVQDRRRLTGDDDTLATFADVPLGYHGVKPHGVLTSVVHCVGENFSKEAWMYKSCSFRNLCYDTNMGEFLYLVSPEERALEEHIITMHHNQQFVTISTMANRIPTASDGATTQAVSLKSLYNISAESVNESWFPTVITNPVKQSRLLSNGYYQLGKELVLFPMHFTSSPQLVWFDLFAMYTVLSIFGLEEKKILIFPYGANSATDTAATKQQAKRYLVALGLESPSDPFSLLVTEKSRSSLVCSKHTVAGLGMIPNSRLPDGTLLTHVMSRAATFSAFRDYILQQLDAHEVVGHASADSTIFALSDPKLLSDVQRAITHNLETVDLTRIELKRMALLIMSARVVVISARTPVLLSVATFLRTRSTLVVIDSNVDQDASEMIVIKDFLMSVGHFRLNWIQPGDGSDHVAKIACSINEALS
jgi:hypothetical protein